MRRLTEYVRESWRELTTRVNWPSWPELQEAATVVLVATVIATVLVALMDIVFNKVLVALYLAIY